MSIVLVYYANKLIRNSVHHIPLMDPVPLLHPKHAKAVRRRHVDIKVQHVFSDKAK